MIEAPPNIDLTTNRFFPANSCPTNSAERERGERVAVAVAVTWAGQADAIRLFFTTEFQQVAAQRFTVVELQASIRETFDDERGLFAQVGGRGRYLSHPRPVAPSLPERVAAAVARVGLQPLGKVFHLPRIERHGF